MPATGLWRRGSLPSQVTIDNGVPTAVDGVFNAPTSGESWDNVVYLENLDRMAVLAVSREGVTFRRPDGQATGPYFWDPAKADPLKVSGTTGSQVNPGLYTGVVGGQMWQNRDNFPADVGFGLMGKTAYANENGNDVVYFAGNYDRLWRYTARDLNAANDSWEPVGIRPLSGKDSSGPMALDPVRRILVKPLTATTFGFWDVSDLATSRTIENREIEVVPTPVSSQIAGDARLYGLQYDPTLEAFVLWGGDSSVWVLHPPGNLDPDGDGIKDATAGWSLEKITPTGSGPTVPARFTGVFGKWVYLPAEKAYLGVIDPDSGDVYLYKPAYNVTPTADASPPAIQPNIVGTLGSAGWYRSDVQWTWSINDPESTVSDSTGCDPGSLSIDTTGQTFTLRGDEYGRHDEPVDHDPS